MQHVSLDAENESVKQFILSLSTNPGSSVLELNGQAVLQVTPITVPTNGADEEWTEEKNARRCQLIDREIANTLTLEEAQELARLQQEMLRYRRRVAPLPLEDARDLCQDLLQLPPNS